MMRQPCLASTSRSRKLSHKRRDQSPKTFRVSTEKQVPESKPLALQLAWASISILETKSGSERTLCEKSGVSKRNTKPSRYLTLGLSVLTGSTEAGNCEGSILPSHPAGVWNCNKNRMSETSLFHCPFMRSCDEDCFCIYAVKLVVRCVNICKQNLIVNITNCELEGSVS